jgi:hypothetical protein
MTWTIDIGSKRIGPKITIYSIDRDHSIETKCFRVCVREPYVQDDGVGLQVRTGTARVFGISITYRRRQTPPPKPPGRSMRPNWQEAAEHLRALSDLHVAVLRDVEKKEKEPMMTTSVPTSREELDRRVCQACNKSHPKRMVFCHEHPFVGVSASYQSTDGTMRIECRRCQKLVLVVVVAGQPASKENIA